VLVSDQTQSRLSAPEGLKVRWLCLIAAVELASALLFRFEGPCDRPDWSREGHVIQAPCRPNYNPVIVPATHKF